MASRGISAIPVRPNRRYEIDQEPGPQNWLFTLDYPGVVPPGAVLQSDHHLFSRTRIRNPLRYQMASLAGPNPEELGRDARWMALNTGNTRVTPRLQALVDDIRSAAASPLGIADRMLELFTQENFIYTLRPPLLESDAPVDQFLFETRRGFCGHFASSFAIVMRLAGVPARLVTGYLGGEVNPRTNQIVVRQSEAHAWVEIHDPAAGWVRVDPTAAVAPERIEFPIDYDSSIDGEGLVLFRDVNIRGLRRLAIELEWFRDSIKAQWNRWFTTFDRDRQQQLLENLGLDGIDLRLVSIVAFLGAIGLLALISLWLFRREREVEDPVWKLYRIFLQRLTRRGVAIEATEGPRDLEARAIKQLPDQAEDISAITAQYVALRYAGADDIDGSSLARLRNLVRRF